MMVRICFSSATGLQTAYMACAATALPVGCIYVITLRGAYTGREFFQGQPGSSDIERWSASALVSLRWGDSDHWQGARTFRIVAVELGIKGSTHGAPAYGTPL
jgi:hypothetical protein